jgi:large subunit ribosomal protein L24
MNKPKIKKNDEVLVIRGKDKGARGKVMRVMPGAETAIVEHVNMMKRHTRPNPQKNVQGGVLVKEAPIRLAHLKLICP